MTLRCSIFFAVVLFAAGTMLGGTRRLAAVSNESSIAYRVHHPLHEMEAVSKQTECDVDVDQAAKTIRDVEVRVDVTTFDSGNSNRDSHAMEVVDALTYPEATFKSSALSQKGDSIFVDGALTFHGITHDIRIAATTEWTATTLTVTGSFAISLTAFHIERPSLLLIPVDDTLRFNFIETFTL